MRKLMISLDKQIIESNSRAANRMEIYGEKDELYILIPHQSLNPGIKLGERVKVETTGGSNKLSQFYNLIKRGRDLLKKYEINFITTQDPFFTGFAGLLLRGRNRKILLEVQVHGDFYSTNYYRDLSVKSFIQYYIGKNIVLKNCDKIRVAGQRIKESLIRLGLDKSKIRVMPVLVTYEMFKNAKVSKQVLRNRFDWPHGKIFVWLGRMESVKNLEFLLEIFKKVVEEKPDSLLLLVGDGSERKKLEEQRDSLNLQHNVRFESWVQFPMEYFKGSDCLVFPSLSEGYGLVVCEARAAGIPIIMTDVGVANYELKPSERVKIIPVDDSEAFIAAMLKI